MLATFLIMLREGLEAALVISIIAIFLARMGKQHLFKYLYLGVSIAFLLCCALGTFFHLAEREFPQSKQELIEGVIGIVAVVVLTWMVFWMRKAGRKIKLEIEEKLEETVLDKSSNIEKVLISMAFFAVLREGVESVLFLFAAGSSSNALNLLGAVLGLLSAVLIGCLIYKGSTVINIAKFFHYTSIAIIVFASGLLAGSLRKFTEAGLFSSFQDKAYNISGVLKNNSLLGTIFGSLIGYDDSPAIAELFVYLTFLIVVLSIFLYTSQSQKKKRELSKLATLNSGVK